MRILLIGDIVGRPGRRILRELLPGLVEEYRVNFVIANGENSAGGVGITPDTADELFRCGVEAITNGNHIWDKREIYNFLDQEERIVRPANYPPGAPGRGWTVLRSKTGVKVGVINLSGRVFLDTLDCPFRAADEILESLAQQTPVILVDFHAEATSEKQAFGWYLDGRVTAVCGTHTHVQTNDGRILPGGTAFITDLGMTGPCDGILGVQRDPVIKKFLTQMPVRFGVADGAIALDAVVLDVDESTGKCRQIITLRRFLEP